MHPDDGNTEDLPGQDTQPSPPPDPAEADLERRPDNVGQSGRWRHKETGKTPRYAARRSDPLDGSGVASSR